MKKNKTKFRLKKILFSVIGVFVFAFSFALTNFNFSPVEAQAQVLTDYTPLVPVDNTTFYSRYDLLEYVSNNGSAYINTGYNPTGNTMVVADFMDNSSVSSYRCLFGVRTNPGNNQDWANLFSYYDVASGSVTNKLVHYGNTYYSAQYNITSPSNIGIRSLYLMGGGMFQLRFNGNTYSNSTSVKTFTSSRPFYLCALNEVDGGAIDVGNFRVYSFKIYDSYLNTGNLVRDFVPARQKSNGLVGMYDLVNNRFYSSANSNNFVAGPQVYTVNFYNGSTLYNSQSFTSKSDFVSPEAPSVPTGSTFLGWSLSNDNNIESVVDTTTLVNSYTQPLNFYSVVVSDNYLAGYDYAKNIYSGFGIFAYSNYNVLKGTEVVLTGRVDSSKFTGYNGGVLLEGDIVDDILSWESVNEQSTTDIRFIFDTPIPVSKYTNFLFNNNFQFGNDITFYFNDGTSYKFAQDDNLGNFVDLTSYNTKFIAYLDIGWASSFEDYGKGLGFSANPSYLDSYNNGFTEGRDVGYNSGFTEGYSQGSSNGYNRGYNLGLEAGNNYSFFGLVSAVIDAPIQAFTGLFDFEIFGTNLKSLFLALFTACVVIVVVKLCLGGK